MGGGSGDKLPEFDGFSTREGDAAKRRGHILFLLLFHTSLGHSGQHMTVEGKGVKIWAHEAN